MRLKIYFGYTFPCENGTGCEEAMLVAVSVCIDRVVIGVVEKTKGERVWRDFRLRWFEREREMMNSCYI